MNTPWCSLKRLLVNVEESRSHVDMHFMEEVCMSTVCYLMVMLKMFLLGPKRRHLKKTAQKMSFTLDCGFTHAAIMSCISDSKGNALPYGVRHKVYLNFSGTYQKNFSFATLKLLIEAYEKYFHEPLQKFTIPWRGTYFQHFRQEDWSKLQIIKKQEHSRQNYTG